MRCLKVWHNACIGGVRHGRIKTTSDRGSIGLMEAVVIVAGVLAILWIFPKVF